MTALDLLPADVTTDEGLIRQARVISEAGVLHVFVAEGRALRRAARLDLASLERVDRTPLLWRATGLEGERWEIRRGKGCAEGTPFGARRVPLCSACRDNRLIRRYY